MNIKQATVNHLLKWIFFFQGSLLNCFVMQGIIATVKLNNIHLIKLFLRDNITFTSFHWTGNYK